MITVKTAKTPATINITITAKLFEKNPVFCATEGGGGIIII